MTDGGGGATVHPVPVRKSAYAVRRVTRELTSLPSRELCPLVLSHTFVFKNGADYERAQRNNTDNSRGGSYWIKFPAVY